MTRHRWRVVGKTKRNSSTRIRHLSTARRERPAISLFPLELWVEIASYIPKGGKDLLSYTLASKATMEAASRFLDRHRINYFTTRAVKEAATVGVWNDQRLRLGISPTEECESISCHGSRGGKSPRELTTSSWPSTRWKIRRTVIAT